MNTIRSASLAIRAALMVAVLGCPWTLASTQASWQAPTERQVVMFGVYATPGSEAMDPKITPVVAAQLRKTLPGHGFKLLQVKSQRVMKDQSLLLDLGDGFGTSAMLLSPLDPNGKVQMKFGLTYQGNSVFQSVVVTPADQFNYFDKMLPNNSHILIGVGAR
jgi:hypothetical protein